MNDQPKPELLSRNVLILLLGVCLVAIAAVVVLVMKPGEREPEKVVGVIEAAAPEEAGVNVLQVEDAIENKDLQAMEGHRYKVLIDDNAREGANGVAHIGGLVTFVPDTKKGDVAIIEVTEIRRTTANATLIELLESGRPVPERRAERPRMERPRRDDSGMVGQIYRGTVEDLGKEGDGIVRVNGKVVFIPDVGVGEHIEFEVVKDAGRIAFGELLDKSDTPYPVDENVSASPAPSEPMRSENSYDGAPVAEGDEYDVTITEADRNNPDVDGVTRIDNFVVFVPGTQPGDKVRIRITDVKRRAANAEVIEAAAAP